MGLLEGERKEKKVPSQRRSARASRSQVKEKWTGCGPGLGEANMNRGTCLSLILNRGLKEMKGGARKVS